MENVKELLIEKRKDERELNVEIKKMLEKLSEKWNNAKIEIDIDYCTIYEDSGQKIYTQHIIRSQIELK